MAARSQRMIEFLRSNKITWFIAIAKKKWTFYKLSCQIIVFCFPLTNDLLKKEKCKL